MKEEYFREEIEQFMRLHCAEYAKGDPAYVIEHFDPEEPEETDATVSFETFDGRVWEIPVSVDLNARNGEAVPAIVANADLDVYLDLSGEGLCAYLWNEAANRLKDAENKIERMERRIAKQANQDTDYSFGGLS